MENEYPLIYFYTHDEAVRRDELPLWRESFKENLCCARAIEKAIRDGGGKHLSSDCAKSVMEEYGIKRTMYVLAKSVCNLDPMARAGKDVEEWLQSADVLPDPEHDVYFDVDAARPAVEEFISQVRQAYEALSLIDRSQYTPLSGVDLNGKVLVLSPETLKEEYWTPKAQLWYAHGGFGCSPNARGRAVLATCIDDDETVFWNRQDFAGVLDERYLPDWAKERLQELRNPALEQNQGMGGMEMK